MFGVQMRIFTVQKQPNIKTPLVYCFFYDFKGEGGIPDPKNNNHSRHQHNILKWKRLAW
jgi:hypothetical protein